MDIKNIRGKHTQDIKNMLQRRIEIIVKNKISGETDEQSYRGGRKNPIDKRIMYKKIIIVLLE